MKLLIKVLLALLLALVLLLIVFNLWGRLTLGTVTPATNPERDPDANAVVMVFGATGSVGDGLLKEDFTDYSALAGVLGEVNTVLWGLGTSSLNVDDATYTRIHVDFPLAFVRAWLAQRTRGPMAFHYVTGMGTDPEGGQHWAREKGRAEQMLAQMAAASDLRTYSYRSAFIRPTSEQSNALVYLAEALLQPGYLVISARELGQAMLEISARVGELPNGTLIDNRDSIEYARAYSPARG